MIVSLPTTPRRTAAAPAPAGARPELVQTYGDACNALAMAAYYLRQPPGNLPAAVRKAGQAMAALRRLQAMEGATV